MSNLPGATEVRRWPAARWLASVLYWFLVPALLMSIVGLVLAVAGFFSPIWVVALGVPASIGLGVWGWRPFRHAAGKRIDGGILPVIVVGLVIAASATTTAIYSAEHLLTNRDPGVYLTTGRWLADEGTLLVSGKTGGFADLEGVEAAGLGYYEVRDDGTLDPQFLHTLPVWGAAAHWLGGDQALFRTNAAVIALALGALWLFAAIVARPWFAVLATAAVAANLVTVHFARDVYSEPLMLLFVFSALAFLALADGSAHFGLSLIAGLMTGAVAMVRIDGWLFVIGVAVYLMAMWWLAQRADDQSTIERFVHPGLLGVLVAGSVGLLDGMVRGRPYLGTLGPRVAMMLGLLVAVVLVGLLALRRPGPFRRLFDRLEDNRRTLAWLIPIAIVAVFALLFLVRPLVQETRGANPNPVTEFAQQYEGLPVDGTRTYTEWSMRWLSWYLGIFGLALGVFGIAWAWRKAILGLGRLWPFLLTVSLTAAVYAFRPSIAPDQLWAMRRFLPIVVPGLILAAVLATQWAFQWITNQPLRWGALALAIVVVLGVPASFTWPLRASTSYLGMYQALEEVCQAIPDGSAVLMASQFHSEMYQAPVRSFCGVAVSGIADDVTDPSCVIAAANEAWDARGVNLVVGYGGNLEMEPDAAVGISYELPELTVTRRPDKLIALGFGISLADADRFDTSDCPG